MKEFTSYEELYDILNREGYRSCSLCYDEEDGKWKRLELKWMLEHFLEKEEYEKCAVLQRAIDSHLLGSDADQEIMNRKLDDYLSTGASYNL